MGCCFTAHMLRTIQKQASTTGKAYADGIDVNAVAGYLRDPRNWIPHLVDGSGAKDVVCALQGPGTDAVSFTYQARVERHHHNHDVHHHHSTVSYITQTGTAQVKRVDVQGDRAVVEVFLQVGRTDIGARTSHYTFTLQRASDTFSSQSGTHIEVTVATTYEVFSIMAKTQQTHSERALEQQTAALMIHIASTLSARK